MQRSVTEPFPSASPALVPSTSFARGAPLVDRVGWRELSGQARGGAGFGTPPPAPALQGGHRMTALRSASGDVGSAGLSFTPSTHASYPPAAPSAGMGMGGALGPGGSPFCLLDRSRSSDASPQGYGLPTLGGGHGNGASYYQYMQRSATLPPSREEQLRTAPSGSALNTASNWAAAGQRSVSEMGDAVPSFAAYATIGGRRTILAQNLGLPTINSLPPHPSGNTYSALAPSPPEPPPPRPDSPQERPGLLDSSPTLPEQYQYPSPPSASGENRTWHSPSLSLSIAAPPEISFSSQAPAFEEVRPLQLAARPIKLTSQTSMSSRPGSTASAYGPDRLAPAAHPLAGVMGGPPYTDPVQQRLGRPGQAPGVGVGWRQVLGQGDGRAPVWRTAQERFYKEVEEAAWAVAAAVAGPGQAPMLFSGPAAGQQGLLSSSRSQRSSNVYVPLFPASADATAPNDGASSAVAPLSPVPRNREAYPRVNP